MVVHFGDVENGQEEFLFHQRVIFVQAGDDGRLDIVAPAKLACRNDIAAVEHLPILARQGDVPLIVRIGALVDDRAHEGVALGRVAHFELGGERHHLGHKRIVDRRLYVDP